MQAIDKRYDVFISYAHKDNLREQEYPITQLVNLLKETYRDRYGEDIEVFFDVDGLKPGDTWENKLLESLRQSAVMIVILSNNYYNSEYCYKEWRHFLDVEIHYSLPGQGIIPNQYSDGTPAPEMEIDKPDTEKWVRTLQARQCFGIDISDWDTKKNTEEFKQRMITVCEQICDRRQRLAERQKTPTNVRPHNVNFTGRAQEIHDIHAALIQSSVGVITAIKGIGGIGKSTIAYEYAHAYIDYYQGGTFNFNAEGQDDFRIALASIAAVMGIVFTEEEQKNLDLQCQRVWQKIAQGPPALLILDNVDKSDILKRITDFAPDRHKLHILVTSRQGFVASKNIKEFRIPPLDQLPSLGLLLKLFPAQDEDEWKAANSITLRLGGHPLSLTMVGTYLENRQDMSYASQLQWLEDEGIEALNIMSDEISLGDYAEPVPAKIFGQIFSLLTPVEMRVLEYAALLPPDSIPSPWLFDLVKDEFPEMVPDPNKAYRNPWNDLVKKLERLQLVIPSVEEPKVGGMHRLIQEAIRQRHDRNQEYSERLIQYCFNRADCLDDGDWVSKDNRWEIAPLGAFSRQYLGDDNIKVTSTSNLVAKLEMGTGLLTEAKRLWSETIRVCEKHLGSCQEDWLMIYVNIAEVERRLGNLSEAKQYLEKALEIDKKDSASAGEVLILAALGGLERELGNFEEAKRLLEIAIETCENSFELDCSAHLPGHLAAFYSNLGNIERGMGNMAKAKQVFIKSFDLLTKHFGSDHPYLMSAYSHLGIAERDLGNFAEAKRLLLQAVAITEKNFDLDHPDLMQVYSNLGATEMDIGNLVEAKRFFERAIEIQLKHFAPDHHNLAACYSNLGNVEQVFGNSSEAKQFYEKAIEITEKHFGSDHPGLAMIYSNLANVEQTVEAQRRWFSRAIEITEKHFGSDHPDLTLYYINLSTVFLNIDDLPEAKRLIEMAIEIYLKHFAPDHPGLAHAYSNLASLECALGNLPEAKRLLERAIEIEEKIYDADHPTLATCYSNLGTVERDLGNLPEAKRLLEKAIAIEKKIYDADHPSLAIRYSNLGTVEKDLGNLEEAIRLSREAFLICRKRQRQLKAQKELDRLRKIDPNIESFLAEHGIILPDENKPEAP